MSGRHKYIRTLVEGEVEELYNLEADPEELTNLALDPKYLTKLREMRAATLAELKRTDAGLVNSLPGFSHPAVKLAIHWVEILGICFLPPTLHQSITLCRKSLRSVNGTC